MGVVVGLQASSQADAAAFRSRLAEVCAYLRTSRPTAVNLFWAIDRMERRALAYQMRSPAEMLNGLLEEALATEDEDRRMCRAIGAAGAGLVRDGMGVLTHCNAGGLATADYGTALAVLFSAHEQGRQFEVYVDETRPLLQGARLTAWELVQAGIDATLICDDMAAAAMRLRKIDLVLVGADRIAANGDPANKIGPYGVAILPQHPGVPFSVAAPTSTFDTTIPDGSRIPIEERAASEVTHGFGSATAPQGVRVWNPAFDVTPHELIAGIVTEHGILERPDSMRVAEFFAHHEMHRGGSP